MQCKMMCVLMCVTYFSMFPSNACLGFFGRTFALLSCKQQQHMTTVPTATEMKYLGGDDRGVSEQGAHLLYSICNHRAHCLQFSTNIYE
jgi:hypothetical protein